MHPSDAIRGGLSQLLSGRRIVVGISGSIAAIESVRIIRELIRHGADVRAVMSHEATRIVSEEALTFATGYPPILELTGQVEHVAFLGPGEERADLLLIAPATANTVSKVAQGIDDTPVTSFASMALGAGVPILIAPAMHGDMGRNPAVRENLDRLRQWGVGIVSPTIAEGEEKLASPEAIAAAVLHRLVQSPWRDQRVLVIGGASRESIDDVRSISNESSGETALAIATQAHYRGANVEAWLGGIRVPVPSYLSARTWRSLEDLRGLMHSHPSSLTEASAIFVPAALSDYTVTPRPGKISSRDTPELTLELHQAPKILPELRRRAPPPTRMVGFKLEAGVKSAELEKAAQQLLVENHLDGVVANERSSMGQLDARWRVITSGGARHMLAGAKSAIAGKLLDDLGREYFQGGAPPSVRASGKPAAEGKTRPHRTRRRPSAHR